MTAANSRSPMAPLAQRVVLVFLLGLFLIGAAPGYLKGQWNWQKTPNVTVLKQLGNLQNQGITLPGWTRAEPIDLQVGGHEWVLSQFTAESGGLAPAGTPALVLMRSQLANTDMPQIDWTDIKGQFQWVEDDIRHLTWTADTPQGPQKIEARFVRGWKTGQVYAALQWYAWPDGGSPEPGDWFWRDRVAQVRGQRVPWVAVAVLLPLQQTGDLDAVQSLAEAVGSQVQQAIATATWPKSTP